MTDVLEPPRADDAHRAHGARQPSKGVALTNWLVSKATGALEKRASRRGFLIGSAMVGSAVAVTGCSVVTRPGPPYTHVTDCGPSFCTDGYTEFCCSVNNGLNSCPPGSFAGGWWRADYSSFCNGTRYYIDCMENCCGPGTGYGNFCAGCTECSCANGCNTRRVYCNYFRYGQCHQEIVASGPIACRVVTCTPPYEVGEWACSTASAVDNSTAEHAGNCPPPGPGPKAALLPSSGSAIQTASGRLTVFVSGVGGNVYYKDYANGSWTAWQSLGGSINSGIGSATFNNITYVIARGGDREIYGNRRDGDTWSGWHLLAGTSSSDPVVVSDAGGIVVLVRAGDNAVYASRFNGSTWSGWSSGGPGIDSEPAAAWDGANTIHVIARAPSLYVYATSYVNNGFTGWTYINEIGASDPTIVRSSLGLFAFVRAIDGTVHWTRYSGSTWAGWGQLGGATTSDPIAFSDSTGVHVVVRGLDGSVYHSRSSDGAGWTGWTPIGGSISADPVAVTGPAGSFVFARGADGALWYGQVTGDAFAGWYSLGGGVIALRASP